MSCCIAMLQEQKCAKIYLRTAAISISRNVSKLRTTTATIAGAVATLKSCYCVCAIAVSEFTALHIAVADKNNNNNEKKTDFGSTTFSFNYFRRHYYCCCCYYYSCCYSWRGLPLWPRGFFFTSSTWIYVFHVLVPQMNKRTHHKKIITYGHTYVWKNVHICIHKYIYMYV